MAKDNFKLLENEWIPLSDGRKLAARIWMPKDAKKKPVPAILEYIPYRKRDGTAPRDESTYPVFAEAGYAGVRVDISGTGESDGDFDDEYSERELADACELIEWIAGQPWCSGRLGMMGISWGGFNSLQVAALRPPALRAIISIGTTVDRYNDDIHYKNGCLLSSNFAWSSVMLCFASRPPDPELVGDRWKEMWLHRLNTQPFPLETWLAHQRRDDYWKHGSINQDYSAIETPVLIISGWCDGYINAPPAAVLNLSTTTKAINGPWIHKYPHFAWPKPRMDFLREAIRWWDHWLRDIDNQVEDLPAYRAYISEDVLPLLRREYEPGRWVAESKLPADNIRYRQYYLAPNRQLLDIPGAALDKPLRSPLDCGTACGEFFSNNPESDLPGDQRLDDAGSLVFDSAKLHREIEILGRPKLRIKISVDRPVATIIVRLNDIHSSGEVNSVSWGVLNLTHRNGNESPEPMTPGKTETVEIELDECGYRFLPGHKVRVALSTSYWPMVMPPPEIVTAKITLGANAVITLPVRSGDDTFEVDEPENPDPLPRYKYLSPAESRRWVERDLQNGETRYHVFDDTGDIEIPGHGLCTQNTHQECWSISTEDPLSYRATSQYTCRMHRGDWSIRTESESSFSCDAEIFYIEATVTAYESDKQVNQRTWKKTIKRDFI
ncbi:MAG: CocE/NonD family hydrolase [Gammaproteobacteria bacterium]